MASAGTTGSQRPTSPTAHCRNCAGPLFGDYCHACGQPRLGIADRGLPQLLREFLATLVDVDGRIWRSLVTLLFRPGRLSADYLDGRRQRHLSPIALFLFSGLLYFFAPAITDFELPFADHLSGTMRVELLRALDQEPTDEVVAALQRTDGQFHSRWTESLVRAYLANRQAGQRQGSAAHRYTLADLANDFDRASTETSRLLVAIHVPALATMLWLLHLRSPVTAVGHSVVALHLFAFLLLCAQLMTVPLIALLSIFDTAWLLPWAAKLNLLIVLAYVALTLKMVYRRPAWAAFAGSIALLAGLLAFSLVVYRSLQFVCVLALL
jgi:hypothetical protein